MTPSEAPKALQASECSELLDPMRASCWIFGKFVQKQAELSNHLRRKCFDSALRINVQGCAQTELYAKMSLPTFNSVTLKEAQQIFVNQRVVKEYTFFPSSIGDGCRPSALFCQCVLLLGRDPHKICKNDLDDQT